MTKNLLLAAALAAASCVPARAAATAALVPVLQTQGGTYVPAGAASNLSFIGAPTFRVEVSTPVDTPVLLLSGQGLLYGIRCSSGSVGSYMLAFDSATSAGITVATTGKALTAAVYSSGQITVSASSQTVQLGQDLGLYAEAHPYPFTNGLVAIVHQSAANCYIQARSTSGNNPGP